MAIFHGKRGVFRADVDYGGRFAAAEIGRWKEAQPSRRRRSQLSRFHVPPILLTSRLHIAYVLISGC